MLILHKCRIYITYALLTEGLSTQAIVIRVTAESVAVFTLTWFSISANLIASPLLISILLPKNIAQQLVNQRDFSKFKNLLNQMLGSEEIQQTVQVAFTEVTSGIEMKP